MERELNFALVLWRTVNLWLIAGMKLPCFLGQKKTSFLEMQVTRKIFTRAAANLFYIFWYTFNYAAGEWEKKFSSGRFSETRLLFLALSVKLQIFFTDWLFIARVTVHCKGYKNKGCINWYDIWLGNKQVNCHILVVSVGNL